MHRSRTRPVGRGRTLVVLAALATSVLGGALPAAAAPSHATPPGIAERVEEDTTVTRGWTWVRDDGTVSSQGWTWVR